MQIENNTTFGELRSMLPTTGCRRVPGIQQLRNRAELLLKKDTASGTIEIFDNGFFMFEECGKSTVYGVDRCASMKTYDSYAKNEMTDELDPYPWDLILESAATARLGHNFESREQSQSEISMDTEESQNNPALSVRPEHEIREEDESDAEWRKEKYRRMGAIFEGLTDKQKQAIVLKRVEKLTQNEIAARMGISRTAVRKHLSFAERKIMALKNM